MRYAQRMMTRATPFGLFSGCSVGRVGAASRLVLAPRRSYRRHTRLDMDYLFALTEDLGRLPELRRRLRLTPNSSLYLAAGRWRYAEARLDGRIRSHHLVAVETAPYLEGRLIESAGDDTYQTIDQGLLELLRHPARLRDYDLISGLAGYAVYALEGLSRPAARSCLELLVAGFAASATGLATGVAWFTPPEHLLEDQQKLTPKGYYNLGVAHGLPAVVAVLGRICGAGVALATARPLLDWAVSYLLSQELAGDAESCFPQWVGEDADVQPSRLAWCYGDPGVAATLLLAARSVGSEEWEREACRIARRAAARRFEGSAVRDGGLCHGAAGLGHLFNRLHQATGDESLAAAARFWFRKALEMRHPGEGVAGFQSWRPDEEGTLGWRDEKGFLTGAAGVALALLGAVTPLEPQWDRVLLTSVL